MLSLLALAVAALLTWQWAAPAAPPSYGDISHGSNGQAEAVIRPASPPPIAVEAALDWPDRATPREVAPSGSPTTDLDVVVRSADDRVRPGVLVMATPQLTVDPWLDERSAATDAVGTAHFTLAAGSYSLRTPFGGAAVVQIGPGEHASATLRLPPGATVRCRVIDADAQPIASAEVLLLDRRTAARAHLVGVTDPKGECTLTDLAGTSYLTVQHPQFAPATPKAVTAALTASVALTFVLDRRFGRCRGIVLDPGSRPIADAVVVVGVDQQQFAAGDARASAPPMQLLRTGADGRFASGPLPPGPIVVLASAPNLGLARATPRIATDSDTEVQLDLRPGATVRGVARDRNGTPIAGACIWNGPLRAFGCRIAVTDGNGSYALTGLPPGEATLLAQQPASIATAAVLQLVESTTTIWDPILATTPAGTVKGRVLDPDHKPLPHWHVVATVPGATSGAAAETDDDGHFAIHGLERNQPVMVAARSPASGQTGFPDATEQTVADGDELELIVRPRHLSGTITGRVLDVGGHGAVTTLHLTHPRYQHLGVYATTSDGRFLLQGVPTGTLQLEVVGAGHARVRVPDLALTAGATLDLGTIQLERGGRVAGTVLGPDGSTPATELRIMDAHQREAGTMEWGPDGYRSPLLPPGDYDLMVQPAGFACTRVRVKIAAEVERRVDLHVNHGMHWIFAVTSVERDHDAAMASIMLFDQAGGPVMFAHRAMAAGAAEFEACLAPGDYSARALGIDGYHQEASFRVAASATETITRLELQPQ